MTNLLAYFIAGPPGGAGSQHGMSVPTWVIIGALVIIAVIAVVAFMRRGKS